MRFAFLVAFPLASATVLAGLTGCSSASPAAAPNDTDSGVAPDHTDSGADASDTDVGSTCGSVESLPAIVTVVSASGASIACDATFAVLSDAGLEPLIGSNCATSNLGGCPSGDADGGPAPCVYAVSIQLLGASSTIEVSEPGFATAIVADVHDGMTGCVPYLAPTEVTVTLSPIADGGVADGSIDGS